MPNRFIGHSIADGQGVILTMDVAVADFLHRSLREVTGVNFADLTHPDDVARNRVAVDGLETGRGSAAIRKRYVRPGSTPVDAMIEVSRLPCPDGGEQLIGTIFAINPANHRVAADRLRAAARDSLDQTRRRASEFGRALFSDHGWEIVTEVYLAETEGRLIRPDEIAERLGESLKTVWHWLLALEAAALIEPVVKAEFAVQLTNDGFAKIEDELLRLVTAGRPIGRSSISPVL